MGSLKKIYIIIVFVCVLFYMSRIVLIWRHKYMAHPRNPGGNVPRRIQNEEEILQMATRRFPDCTVMGVSLETLNMTQQVE